MQIIAYITVLRKINLMTIVNISRMLLQTGLGSLAAYLAAHVLLCLLPAFFIAGALAALVPKQAITKYLGRKTPKWISYPASALGVLCWQCVPAR